MTKTRVSNTAIFSILSYLIFFPSITFSILYAEIFPWALLFSFIFIKKINKNLILFLLIAILSSLYGIYLSRGLSSSEILRSIAAYLNPLMIFLVLLKVDYNYVEKLIPRIKEIFIFLIILGFLQYFEIIYFLDSFFKFIIPRGHAISLSHIGNRGVSLLSSEPSRAAYELIFIYISFRTIYLKQSLKIYFDVFIALFLFFIVKSGIGLIMLFVFFLIYYRLKFLIAAAAISIILLSYNYSIDNRAFSILISIISTNSYSELYLLLINSSGFRLISVISSFLYGITNPLGGGIGNWQITSIEALKLTSFSPNEISYFRNFHNSQWASIRTTSYFFSLMLDLGIVGATSFLLYLLKYLRRFKLKSKEYYNAVAFFLFYFLFVGAVGNPVPFICIAITLRFLNFQNKYISNDSY